MLTDDKKYGTEKMFYLNVREQRQINQKKFESLLFFNQIVYFITLVTMTLKILFKKMIIVYMCVDLSWHTIFDKHVCSSNLSF